MQKKLLDDKILVAKKTLYTHLLAKCSCELTDIEKDICRKLATDKDIIKAFSNKKTSD